METSTDKAIEFAKTELLAAQNERDSLMRWKLVLVSAIGATALGFSQQSPVPNAEFALCLIPFTCVYVDLLCRNLSMRTKMLSLFLSQQQNDPLENFYQSYQMPRGSSLETLALRNSTLFVSILIVPLGIIASAVNPSDLIETWLSFSSLLFYLSGLSGILLSCVVEKRYQAQKRALSSCAAAVSQSITARR